MVALDYFRRLGHDNHRRLSKLYAWEEKKSKTSWGAQTVDYEKTAISAVKGMNPADVHRFLVVCALVSDLILPRLQPEGIPWERHEPCTHGGAPQSRYREDSYCCPRGTLEIAKQSQRPSVVTSKSAICGRLKTGHMNSLRTGFFYSAS